MLSVGFHAFGWFAVAASLFMLADLQRRGGVRHLRWVGHMLTDVVSERSFDAAYHRPWCGKELGGTGSTPNRVVCDDT